MIKIIYFVHGTTYDNAEGKCSGWKQAELTELGKERAKILGILRKDTHFDVILVVYEEHISEPFPNGESLKDVEKRIKSFIEFLKENYQGKTVGIVAHRAPQLAFEVLTKNISWEEANNNDWRKTKNWQPDWEYIIK